MTSAASTPQEQGASAPLFAQAASGAAGVGVGSRVGAWVGLGVALVLAAAVFWAFDALPFMDLPAHAGIIALRHRWEASPFEQRFLVYAPHVGPYSLFRFLGELLVKPLGPLGAVRFLATLPVFAVPAAVLFARKRLHGDASPAWGHFAVVLSFGLMTLFGFASYLLGVAGLLVVLTLWLHLLAGVDEGAGDLPRRELMVLGAAPLLFVAHGHAFVLFLLLAGASCVVGGRRAARLLRGRALVPAVALAAYVAWIERGSQLPAGAVETTRSSMVPTFQGAYDKFTLLITPTLMTRSGLDFLAGVVVWALLSAAVVFTVRGQKRAEPRARLHGRALLACIVTVAAAFLLLPHSIGWFGFIDGRLVPLILLLALVAVRRDDLGSPLARIYDRAAVLLAAVTLGTVLVASGRFQDEARGYREVLAQVPPYVRLLNLPLEPDSAVFTAHPFVHYDKLVMAERPVVVSDIWFHQGSALYPRAENPATRLPASYVESDLRGVDLHDYAMSEWDYVLVRTRPDASTPAVPSSLRAVAHEGGWWLFHNTEAKPLTP